ncbi:Na+/H+ antiporter subunit A, partial [Staphylococcus caprae]
ESSMLMLISPIILTSLVIVFGLFPSILTQSIIEPASEAVSQTSNITAEFHLFHGITPAFLSTIGIYIIGILLLISFSYWIRLLQAHPYQLTLNHWYDTSSRRIPGYSENITN